MLFLQIYVSVLAAYPNHFTIGQNDATRKISVQNLKLRVGVFCSALAQSEVAQTND